MEEDPASYVALLAMCVFQTSLSAGTYDTLDAKRMENLSHAVDGRLYWEDAERIHEYVGRQGFILRQSQDVPDDLSEIDRIDELRDIVLDYGRAMLSMAQDLNNSNRYLNATRLRASLDRDVEAAFGLSESEWVDPSLLAAMPFVPPVIFVSDPMPDLTFTFASE